MAIAIEHVIAASSIKGVGRQFLLRCIDDCSDASEINYENFVAFVAPEKHKRICRGAGSCNQEIEMKELKKAYDHTLKLLERSADEKIFYIGSNSSKYPRRLRRSKDHPLFLFYRGNLEICDTMRCAAVIGTRQPSADALKAEKKAVMRLPTEQRLNTGKIPGKVPPPPFWPTGWMQAQSIRRRTRNWPMKLLTAAVCCCRNILSAPHAGLII